MTTPLSDNRFLPQDTGFKHWSCFCPPQTPAKKLAMVPSLQPAFLKMPMAPTFLSSSNTRRHNNARPHPLHTLLSAAAERSSYGYKIVYFDKILVWLSIFQARFTFSSLYLTEYGLALRFPCMALRFTVILHVFPQWAIFLSI